MWDLSSLMTNQTCVPCIERWILNHWTTREVPGILLFLLLWSPWLGLPKLCWIIVTRVDTPVLFLILEEMLSVITVENDVCCGFVIYGLYYVEVCSLYAHFLERFYHKSVLNFVRRFFCIYWDDHVIILQFVNMVYHIDWLVYIEESLLPWDKSHLIMVHDPLMYCWIWFGSILLTIFTSMVISDIGL